MASPGSFWISNPCVPTWSQRISAWWGNRTVQILEPGWKPIVRGVPGYTLRRARDTDVHAITELWSRYYSTSSSCVCRIPASFLQERIRSNQWETYLVIQDATGFCVGTIVRRWLQGSVRLQGTAVLPRAAIVDYFCTAPNVRKLGIGRWLLQTLHAQGPTPLPPHFILWEGLQVSIPPTVSAMYWSRKSQVKREGTVIKLDAEGAKGVWNKLILGRDICMEWTATSQPKEMSFWRTSQGDVILWNTFHRSVPEQLWIAVVVAATSAAAVNACAEEKGMPFGILVSSGKFAEGDAWSFDSPFQWVTYNLLTSFCSNEFPMFLL